MFQTKVVDEGHKAYYDDVPRYKNPYDGDRASFTLWFTGWDKASEEHNLFTENQTLKAENKELVIERAEVLEENMFLNNDLARLESSNEHFQEVATHCQEDAKHFAKALEYQCKDMDKLRASTVEISVLLRTAFYYSTDSTIFSFRREILIDYLKKLRVKIDAMEESFPEKTIKSEKKA